METDDNRIQVNTQFSSDQIRQTVTDPVAPNPAETIAEYLIDLRDQEVRRALIELGWATPEDRQALEAAVEEEIHSDAQVRKILEKVKEERTELGRLAHTAVDERDALAAHVEELKTLLHGAQLGLRWFRDEHPDEDTETDAEFDTQVAVALQSSPATSLARLKATVIQEAADVMRQGYEPTDQRARGWADAVDSLDGRASKLRRQAEEGS